MFSSLHHPFHIISLGCYVFLLFSSFCLAADCSAVKNQKKKKMTPVMCASTANSSADGGSGGEGIMLFGVRVVVDSMRKSVSMNNLSQYEHPPESNNNKKSNNNNNGGNKGDDNVTTGYASADDAVPQSTGNRERKRGVPWTEEEHKLFLLGLQKVGKGDWRGISRNFVKTRTPTQVASHAQKYFLRRTNLNRRRRRSSLFDITTDSVAAIPMEEEQQAHQQDNTTHPPENNGFAAMMPVGFPMTVNPVIVPTPIENPMENLTLSTPQGNQMSSNATAKIIRSVPILPASQPSDFTLKLNSTMDPSPLSLKLSLQSDQMDSSSPSSCSRHSAFQVMPSTSNGDSNSIISLA